MDSRPTHYTSADEDSARWDRFSFRDGDIVISTRSKSGTTWMQMICALLVFQRPDPPAPLAELSPWVDWLVEPLDEMLARLEAQRHRRFVKTHTPLDGVPIDDRATYIVVVRHPLDLAVSLYHHSTNIDRVQWRRLTGQPAPTAPPPPRPPIHEWLMQWIVAEVEPAEQLDSLPGVVHHAADAWGRRAEPNVLLVHYDDLSLDLEAAMRRIAERLDIVVPEDEWPGLVEAAGFASMRSNAELLAPDPAGVLADHQAFFRAGQSGAGAALLSPVERERYRRRVSALAGPGVLDWLHHGPMFA